MAIRTLLVANRGEIAARIFRTCSGLGIRTVAVASPADRGAYHTRRADDVVEVGGYMSPQELVQAALSVDADAVHPGYGFLSEKPELAEAVQAAGLLWVGPPPVAMRLAADKLAARRSAEEAGVPTVPAGAPGEIGFPLILKAAGGGGGRGMRVVRAKTELEAALETAGREAHAAFGDDRVFAEQLVEGARHIEVQLLGDRRGTLIDLGARDCSVQRRHQKLLEEAPPVLAPEVLERLREAALTVGRAAGYENAGTAEFLVRGDELWFIELNARLQVEHPVTELVTGLDLVELQLRLAEGESVPEPPPASGHAVEVRLYAEHPVTFVPQPGRVESLRLPASIRVDPGLEAGDEVPLGYDPLIAKLVAHGETRDEALSALARALAETRVTGVTTNLELLRWLVAHPGVRASDVTIDFLDETPPLSPPSVVPPPWDKPWRLNAASPPRRSPPARSRRAGGAGDAGGEVTAPLPGRIIEVLVREGEQVAARQPLVVLEAMKMETPVVAPGPGSVLAVAVREDDQVAAGALLVRLG